MFHFLSVYMSLQINTINSQLKTVVPWPDLLITYSRIYGINKGIIRFVHLFSTDKGVCLWITFAIKNALFKGIYNYSILLSVTFPHLLWRSITYHFASFRLAKCPFLLIRPVKHLLPLWTQNLQGLYQSLLQRPHCCLHLSSSV